LGFLDGYEKERLPTVKLGLLDFDPVSLDASPTSRRKGVIGPAESRIAQGASWLCPGSDPATH
jgi:hypothetical protein